MQHFRPERLFPSIVLPNKLQTTASMPTTSTKGNQQGPTTNHKQLKDTQITTAVFQRVATAQDLCTPFAIRNFKRADAMTYPSKVPILNNYIQEQLAEIAQIIKFKIELKTQLQSINIDYDAYLQIESFNQAAGLIFELFEIDAASELYITESDFDDFKLKILRQRSCLAKQNYHPNYDDSITVESFETYLEKVVKKSIINDDPMQLAIVARLTYGQLS